MFCAKGFSDDASLNIERSTYSLLDVTKNKTHFMLYRLLTHNNQQTNEHSSCKSACPEVFFFIFSP